MPVGVGARELGGDLGAIDRGRHHAEGVTQHAHVEAAEMKQLQRLGVAEHGGEARRRLLTRRDAHDLGVAVAAAQLHHAEPVATEREAHGLGVDGDRRSQIETLRKVAFVKPNRHRETS